MSLRQSSLARQYVLVPVSATVGGVAINPTTLSVELAFLALAGDPVAGDWKAASWEPGGPPWYARCLVGPGGTVALAVGTYYVWIRVTDNPEIPVVQVDTLTII